MTACRNRYIVKAKGIYCARLPSDKTCYLSIKDGVIQSISDEMPDCPGDEIVDFGSLAISPCFCDYHLHFSEQVRSAAESIGIGLLRSGIARAYEGGDKGLTGLSVRETLKGMPKIMTSGYALFKTGGYGMPIGRAVKGYDDAGSAINELQSLQVDYIKIINSGIYDPESNMITKGGFEVGELKRIVCYARERGLDVYCHANGEEPFRAAVDAGVSAVIHGLHAHDETFSKMAEKNVAFIPTVRAFQGLLSIAKTAAARRNIERTVEAHLSAVRRAFDRKVRVLPGSDSGPKFIPYGSAYIDELRLFQKSGMSIEDVLRSAAGPVLTEGARANFVLLNGLSVEQVVVSGQFLL